MEGRLEDAIDRWLSDGPLPIEELAERAVVAGLLPDGVDDDGWEPGDHIEGLLERSDGYWSTDWLTGDDVVALTSTFTDTGMTLTHRVSAEELRSGALDDAPDLSILGWNSPNGLPLDDGTGRVEVDHSQPGGSRLVGPPGWLEGVGPGDLLVLRREDGVVSVEVAPDGAVGAGDVEREALRDAASTWIGDGRGCEEVPVLMDALVRDARLFRSAVPPVGELLADVGLERRGTEWGRTDEEWRTSQEAFADHRARVRRLYGLDRCCERAYERVEEAWQTFSRGEEVDGDAIADDLGHGAVVEACGHVHDGYPTIVAGFASALVATATGRRSAAASTLLGRALLRARQADQAYDALDAAVRADPELPAAGRALALLELDRGNVDRAHALAVRSEDDPHLVDWIAEERARRAALRPAVGRNDPCPCGSGRKAKRCCGGGGPLTLAQRVPFILRRMVHHATGPEGHDTIFGLGLSAASDHDDVVAAVRRFIEDPFLVDLAVHEGELGARYYEERSQLLAEDELDLLDRVLDEPRRLWEVTAVVPGASLTLRDTRSGEVVTVTERVGSEGREPGELLLARVARVEDEAMVFGVPLVVPLRERERVLQMLDQGVDADSLAMWFGSLHLPPRVRIRDGDDEIEVQLGDVDGHPFEPLVAEDPPPEVRELLERHIREYEERWVDEPVPALGGLTPRQAWDDPTRREDLLAVLRELRRHRPPGGEVGMSVDRIERLLGIDRA